MIHLPANNESRKGNFLRSEGENIHSFFRRSSQRLHLTADSASSLDEIQLLSCSFHVLSDLHIRLCDAPSQRLHLNAFPGTRRRDHETTCNEDELDSDQRSSSPHRRRQKMDSSWTFHPTIGRRTRNQGGRQQPSVSHRPTSIIESTLFRLSSFFLSACV